MINKNGYLYEKNQKPGIRKLKGQYYTSSYIIKYILKDTVELVNIVENPYVKVIDPSCGAGYFLLEVYDILKDKFLKNIENLKKVYGDKTYILEKDGEEKRVMGDDYWKKENIHYHILKHCIYGADKDEFAVKLTIEALVNKQPNEEFKNLNIVNCDSLVRWEAKFDYKESKNIVLNKFWSNKFDFCVGNPPYIGHKQMNKEYKEWLSEEYKEVFKDKSDISFCFFSRILDILSPNGICGIITSRYFMESPMGKNLRKFLKDKTKIIQILDFYGADIFKNVGIATAIFIFGRHEDKNNSINVFKLKNKDHKFEDILKLEEVIKTNVFENFVIKQNTLENHRWILISNDVNNIYKKFENKGNIRLKDIVNSFQGIITGCDKAFVLTKDKVMEKKIEKTLIRKWIKNKDVQSYNISKSNLKLIYSNLINDPEKFSNALNHISIYTEKLKNRRECRNGIRKWYELQWGREIELFQKPKIIFPYKSKTNRFAIDYEGRYFSADIYGLIIKSRYKESLSLEYLVGLLNSKVYEYYFKIFAKQMGKGIYDYYPNALLDLNIITDTIIQKVEKRVDNIMNLINNNLYNDLETQNKIKIIKEEIDSIIMDYFEFNSVEREIIIKDT